MRRDIHGIYTGFPGDTHGRTRGFPGGALSPCKYTCPNMPYGHPSLKHLISQTRSTVSPRVSPGQPRALHRARQGRTPRAYRGEPPTSSRSTRPSEPPGSPQTGTVRNLHGSIIHLRCSNTPLRATVSPGGRHGRYGEPPKLARVPATACRDVPGGPRAGIPPTPCPPGDDPGGERSPPTR